MLLSLSWIIIPLNQSAERLPIKPQPLSDKASKIGGACQVANDAQTRKWHNPSISSFLVTYFVTFCHTTHAQDRFTETRPNTKEGAKPVILLTIWNFLAKITQRSLRKQTDWGLVYHPRSLSIAVSFMQSYTRLPVKVKVFTVPVKGCIPLTRSGNGRHP